ncbi:MAG: ThuA domain-containing protein [Sphingomonadales bacterium]|nr:ThuA domain-containing protein [Sphingomonadales bacterium]
MKAALLFVAGLLAFAAPASARPVADCPLADAPFSTRLPLIDLMLSPAASAIIEQHMPGITAALPKAMFGTTPPSFAAIITLAQMGAMGGKSEAQMAPALAAIDADLARLPVTATDRAARCARYDEDRPALAVPTGHPRLLLFEKINGFKDTPSVNAAHAAFLDLARANGWAIVTTDKGGAFNPQTLRRFDAVIWNNISGDVLTLSERAAFKAWITRGGAFLGIHGSDGDPVTWWDWYTDDLIGARFLAHPFPRQFQAARVVIDDPNSPIAAGLPPEFTLTEEWYSFRNDPRAKGAHVIARLDETSYDPTFMGKQDLRMGADHPIVWTRCVGRGRMFYSAIGHRPEMYATPVYRRLLTNAVIWATDAAGRAECGAK